MQPQKAGNAQGYLVPLIIGATLPIISFCSRSSFVRNGGILASVLTPLHHSDILMDAAFLRTGDLVFHILMAFKHLHHEAFLCWI